MVKGVWILYKFGVDFFCSACRLNEKKSNQSTHPCYTALMDKSPSAAIVFWQPAFLIGCRHCLTAIFHPAPSILQSEHIGWRNADRTNHWLNFGLFIRKLSTQLSWAQGIKDSLEFPAIINGQQSILWCDLTVRECKINYHWSLLQLEYIHFFHVWPPTVSL